MKNRVYYEELKKMGELLNVNLGHPENIKDKITFIYIHELCNKELTDIHEITVAMAYILSISETELANLLIPRVIDDERIQRLLILNNIEENKELDEVKLLLYLTTYDDKDKTDDLKAFMNSKNEDYKLLKFYDYVLARYLPDLVMNIQEEYLGELYNNADLEAYHISLETLIRQADWFDIYIKIHSFNLCKIINFNPVHYLNLAISIFAELCGEYPDYAYPYLDKAFNLLKPDDNRVRYLAYYYFVHMPRLEEKDYALNMIDKFESFNHNLMVYSRYMVYHLSKCDSKKELELEKEIKEIIRRNKDVAFNRVCAYYYFQMKINEAIETKDTLTIVDQYNQYVDFVTYDVQYGIRNKIDPNINNLVLKATLDSDLLENIKRIEIHNSKLIEWIRDEDYFGYIPGLPKELVIYSYGKYSLTMTMMIEGRTSGYLHFDVHYGDNRMLLINTNFKD